MELLEGLTLRDASPCAPPESRGRRSTCRCRWPRRSAPRTRRASSIGISSRRTSSSRAGPGEDSRLRPGASSSPMATGAAATVTRASRCRRRRAQALLTTPGQMLGHDRLHVARAGARRGARRAHAISFRSASCSTRCSPAALPFDGATTGVVFDRILNQRAGPVTEKHPGRCRQSSCTFSTRRWRRIASCATRASREMRADLARLCDAARDRRALDVGSGSGGGGASAAVEAASPVAVSPARPPRCAGRR